MSILRDGRLVRTAATADETESTLIEGMLGRSIGSVFPTKKPPATDARTVLQVSDLVAPGVNGVSLTVRAGEIVGLAGLVGAGRSEIAHAVFGSNRHTSGEVAISQASSR